jgi:hypothetical protein
VPLWYRHAWSLPAACSAFAVALSAAALRPTEQSVLLTVAMLSALPPTTSEVFAHAPSCTPAEPDAAIAAAPLA